MPDYVPLLYRDDGAVVGLEVDFANQLASDLQRSLTLQQCPSLVALFAALEQGGSI